MKEGVEHMKFSDRPVEKISNFVYQTVNNLVYRIYHLVLTVALLLLAILEFPTVFLEEDPSAFSTYQSDWLRVSCKSYVQDTIYSTVILVWAPDDSGFVLK